MGRNKLMDTLPDPMLNDQADSGQESGQGGDTLTLDPANYPDLKKLQEGDDVELTVKGTVEKVNDDGTVDIAPSSISSHGGNPAKAALKGLRGQDSGGGSNDGSAGDSGI